jgi:hypothetical protein
MTTDPDRLIQRLLALYLLLGGLWGVVSLAWLNSTVHVGVATLRLPVLISAPFVLAALSGVALWVNHRWGKKAALLVLAAEVVRFHLPDGLEFQFGTGGCIGIGVVGFDLTLSATIGSAIVAQCSVGEGYFIVNLVAAAAAICLVVAAGNSPEKPAPLPTLPHDEHSDRGAG